MKPFLNGLVTGLLLQLAIGPVWLYIANLALQTTLINSYAAVIAVTLVDYLYIALAILGLGSALKRPVIANVVNLLGPVALLIFGFLTVKSSLSQSSQSASILVSPNPLISFTTVLLLTLTNPMTIIFFTSLFSAKAAEHHYRRPDLIRFGIGTGLATLIFMGTSVSLLSFLKTAIPPALIAYLNALIGCLLILYGFNRIIHSRQTSQSHK